MKGNKEVKLSYWAHHMTTVVSVTLVLLLLGLTALVWIGTHREADRLQERLELSVILRDSVPGPSRRALVKEISAKPYARSVRLISESEAMAQWRDATGEDLEAVFGVNPLSAEISVGLRAGWVRPDSIAAIKASLSKCPDVAEVATPDTAAIESMHRNVSRLTLLLALAAAVMLLISFVLINNTVYLSIYARRFSIHTMQLVGATDGYIRGPVVMGNLTAGLVAGLVAAAVMAAALAGARHAGIVDVRRLIPWDTYALVAAGMTLAGMALCSITAWISSTVYLHKDYDKLFR